MPGVQHPPPHLVPRTVGDLGQPPSSVTRLCVCACACTLRARPVLFPVGAASRGGLASVFKVHNTPWGERPAICPAAAARCRPVPAWLPAWPWTPCSSSSAPSLETSSGLEAPGPGLSPIPLPPQPLWVLCSPRDIMRLWREEVVFLSSCHLASSPPLLAAALAHRAPFPERGPCCLATIVKRPHCWASPGPGPSLTL